MNIASETVGQIDESREVRNEEAFWVLARIVRLLDEGYTPQQIRPSLRQLDRLVGQQKNAGDETTDESNE